MPLLIALAVGGVGVLVGGVGLGSAATVKTSNYTDILFAGGVIVALAYGAKKAGVI